VVSTAVLEGSEFKASVNFRDEDQFLAKNRIGALYIKRRESFGVRCPL